MESPVVVNGGQFLHIQSLESNKSFKLIYLINFLVTRTSWDVGTLRHLWLIGLNLAIVCLFRKSACMVHTQCFCVVPLAIDKYCLDNLIHPLFIRIQMNLLMIVPKAETIQFFGQNTCHSTFYHHCIYLAEQMREIADMGNLTRTS